MINAYSMKPCANFKSLEKGLSFNYINMHSVNCKDCLYFSSRNCGMDCVSSVESDMAVFM
jgi:hypothetical protein